MTKLHRTLKQNADMRRDMANVLVRLREEKRNVGIYASSTEVALVDRLIQRADAWLHPEQPEPILTAMVKWLADIEAARARRAQQAEAVELSEKEHEAAQRRARDAMHAKQDAERQRRVELQLKAEPVGGSDGAQ
jgi:hypothetical protein